MAESTAQSYNFEARGLRTHRLALIISGCVMPFKYIQVGKYKCQADRARRLALQKELEAFSDTNIYSNIYTPYKLLHCNLCVYIYVNSV